ncbi:CAP domain-containing protein [Mycena amicta]|nr:CAP domain-containing protein [Mycena amicta]
MLLIPVLTAFTAIVGAVASTGVVPELDTRSHQLTSRFSLFNATQLSFLWAHNKVRFLHGAQGLVWNDTLANSALSWANGCQLQHSDGSLLSGTPYGENIVAGTGNFPIDNAIQQFTLDQGEYNPATPTYNHFTQVVWKATTQLGCAMSQCSGMLDANLGPASYYVCLYYPPGNVIGQAG